MSDDGKELTVAVAVAGAVAEATTISTTRTMVTWWALPRVTYLSGSNGARGTIPGFFLLFPAPNLDRIFAINLACWEAAVLGSIRGSSIPLRRT